MMWLGNSIDMTNKMGRREQGGWNTCLLSCYCLIGVGYQHEYDWIFGR